MRLGFLSHLVSADRRWRHLLLLVIVAGFAVAKLCFNPGLGRPCLDGDYYYQIARNVAEGRGLSTNLSLYTQGLTRFPHEINHSPIWPLTMGLLGKLFPLDRVAVLLPEALYLVNLVLLYFVVQRLLRSEDKRGNRVFFVINSRFVDVGHLLVVLLGSNNVFFESTSLPYTEAIAFFFLFCAILAADVAAERRSLPVAALAGGFAALAFLSRTQMAGVVLAVPLVYGLVGIRDRRFLAMAGCSVAASSLVFLPWVAWVASWAPVSGWRTFAGSGFIGEVSGLTFSQVVPTESFDARLEVWREGLRVAFSRDDVNSYFYSMGWAIYTVPVAVLASLLDWPELKRAARRALSAEGCVVLIIVVYALAMLEPLHSEKRQFFKPWLFGWRHGLPYFLLIAVATTSLLSSRHRVGATVAAYLLSGKRILGSAVAVLLVGATLSHNWTALERLFEKDYISGPFGPEAQLVEWLDAQDPKPVVITTYAQILSAFSRSYFHWMDCGVSPDHTRALFEKAHADYVLVYPKNRRCRYFVPLKKELELVRTFTNDWTIEVWRPKKGAGR